MYKVIGIFVNEELNTYVTRVIEHLSISTVSLFIAILVGIPLAIYSYKNQFGRKITVLFTSSLRVVPSIGILFVLIPIVGVGYFPSVIALSFLGIPPILIGTLVGLDEVPFSVKETAMGMGMTDNQILYKAELPLSLPYTLNGIKLAMVEIIASATLASYIGAGGLGNYIFTGIALYRYDLIMIGAISVAIITLIFMVGMDYLHRSFKYEK